MKKWIAITLAIVLAISLAACGPINKNEVAVIWFANEKAVSPNDPINAMERAMYTENISYKNYGAQGSASIQLEIAQMALSSGCDALVIEVFDNSIVESILSAVQTYDVPVIFFNHKIDDALLSTYDKCYNIAHDASTKYGVQAQQAKDGKGATGAADKSLHPYDRNGDGKVSYLPIGNMSATTALLDSSIFVPVAESASYKYLEGLTVQEGDGRAELLNANGDSIELILTNADITSLQVLDGLQALGFNKDKLTTHNIPVLTFDNDANAKRFTNTENMTEEELSEYFYTVENLIGEEKMAGTVVEDVDTLTQEVTQLLSALLRGKQPDMEERIVMIPYVGI